ncbi:hypothetical protein [Pseudoxanthomonas sp. GW2]|uniref:hypothetical protein n=1 Tax=Pseudoxanthomonas sp. GW2 TaxID=1211114 RepID=UPI0012EA10F8|nr:hypothetical protein [Pseudoxanthomonas sp. GW2]
MGKKADQKPNRGWIGPLLLAVSALVLASYVFFSNPSGLVLDERAEPVSDWYRFKRKLIGIRFYESQLARYEKSVEFQRQLMERADRRIDRMEEAHASGSDNQDPDLARAESLESEAELIRKRSTRDFSREYEIRYIDRLETTIAAIREKIDEANSSGSPR